MKRAAAFRLALASVIASAFVAACGWDPSRPFDREAPQVRQAIQQYDAGEAGSAALLLEDYLLTGACSEGNIATPNRLGERPNGTFDLGLALFKIGEAYGQRFGDEEADAGSTDPSVKTLRGNMVDCALRIVRKVAEDPTQPASLRARARYLEGNLLFLTGNYQEAVTAYDKALEVAPAMGDAGPIGQPDGSQAVFRPDPVGRDAAWNRAVALRRIEDKKDAGNDAASDGSGEGGGNDGGGDSGGQNGNDGGNDSGGNGGGNDAGNDSGGGGEDAGRDSGNPPPPKPNDDQTPDSGAPPPPSRQSQDERILDQLENAPTVQQEAAKKQVGRRKIHGMTDK